ncbi:Competence/damage inducible protein CinA [Pseudomonas syringae pv. aceris]|nr:Competence/damage inducible protein CinA [Pseudomonas syringae pv. aceris]RMS65159.1 Competence/damage inducible protein CinA [Pseudomonas syringae pv. aceris]
MRRDGWPLSEARGVCRVCAMAARLSRSTGWCSDRVASRVLVTGRFQTAMHPDLAYRLSSLPPDNRTVTYKKGLLYEEQTSKGLCQRALHSFGRSQKKAERNHGGNGQKARAQEK